MKAIVLADREHAVIKEIERPALSPEGALLRVEACGICGGDIRTYFSGFRMSTDNQIMGHEITGEVIAVGDRHDEFSPGDRLALAADIHCGQCFYCKNELFNLCDTLRIIGKHVTGGFAEYFHITPEILKQGVVNQIPEGLDYTSAALSEPLTSVLAAQDKLGIDSGSSVLIIGGGPIGCLHAQLAKNSGAEPVIVSQRNERRLALAKKILDIDALVNPKQEDLKEVVGELTAGIGVDTVIVACASKEAVQDAVKYVRKGGQVDIFGGLPRDDSVVAFDSNRLHYEEITIIGSFSYHPCYHQRALKTIAAGDIEAKKFITVRPMKEFASSVYEIKEGKHLKVILEMS